MSISNTNFLEYFDKEYSNLNELITSINCLFIQTKDDYNKLNSALHNLIQSISDQSLDYDSFNNSIQLLKDFMQNAEEFGTSAKTLYDSVISIAENNNKKIEGI